MEGTYRKFNGKTYRLADAVLGKENAKSRAKGFRKRGDFARVIRSGGLWQVWVRDISSRRGRLGYR